MSAGFRYHIIGTMGDALVLFILILVVTVVILPVAVSILVLWEGITHIF